MFTLHDTIALTKKVLLYAAIGAVGIFILIMLFRFGVFLKNTLFPDPPPPFGVSFGKLQNISFGVSEEGNFSYVLDTLSGTYPQFSDRANVYEITQTEPEFFDLARANEKAKVMGFTTQPSLIGENLYQWTTNSQLRPVMKMNTVTGDFVLNTSFLTYSPLLTGTNRPNTQIAVKEAEVFLSSVNSFPGTINKASTSARMLTVRDGTVVESESVNTTQMVRVDFYHNTVEQLPIYYPDHPQSLIYVLLATSLADPLVIEASYVNKPISSNFSDYPIKTAEEAFKELEAGNGYIASYYGSSPEISIKEIKLGYFMSAEKQKYLMPVVVFFGDNGFVAFVSAVREEYIE